MKWHVRCGFCGKQNESFDVFTSGPLRVVSSKCLVFGGVGIKIQKRVFWDIFSLQDLKISDDFNERDLGKVRFGKGLDCLNVRLTYKRWRMIIHRWKNRRLVCISVYKPQTLKNPFGSLWSKKISPVMVVSTQEKVIPPMTLSLKRNKNVPLCFFLRRDFSLPLLTNPMMWLQCK